MLTELILEPEEKELLAYIWKMIPAEDKVGLTEEDVIYVLDCMDDYLEAKGLLVIDEATGESDYLAGDVDETEQLAYIKESVKRDGRKVTDVQIQLIQDAEFQYGIEQGYYEEEED